MGKVLLESSSCMGEIVSAQALKNKKATMMQYVLAIIGCTDGVISFAFARIPCSLLQRVSAFAKGFGPIKWRGDRAVALESEGG
jgi:hypothetical protein